MDGKGIEFTVIEPVIGGHGPVDVVGIDEDDIKPLVYLAWNAFDMLEQVLTVGGFFTE